MELHAREVSSLKMKIQSTPSISSSNIGTNFLSPSTKNSVKNEAVLTAHRACPEFLTAFIADMQANIHSVLDIKEMCITACVRNKKIVNKIFQECGDKVCIRLESDVDFSNYLFLVPNLVFTHPCTKFKRNLFSFGDQDFT